MRKLSRWLLLALTFCVAVAGFLIRRQQLAAELMPDGSLAEGSSLHLLLAALAGVLFVGLVAFLYPQPKKISWQQVFPTAAVPNLLLLVSAIGLIAGNVLLWRSGSADSAAVVTQSPEVSRALSMLLPPLGVVSAVCFAIFAVVRMAGKKPTPLLFMIASLYLIIRLIVCFQVWNTDPSIHDYAFQLLAAICCMLGCFQLAGFSFDRGHLRMCLFWTLGATAFCAFTVADTLHSGALSNVLINGAFLLAMATCSACLLFTDGPLPQPEETAPENELPAEEPEEAKPEI